MKRRRIKHLSVCLCLLLAMSPAAAFASETVPAADTQTSTEATETATQPTTSEPAAEAGSTTPSETIVTTEPTPTEPASEGAAAPAENEEQPAAETLKSKEGTTEAAQNSAPLEADQSNVPAAAEKATTAPAAKAAAPSEEAKAPAVKKNSPKATAKAKLSDTGIKVSGGVEGTDWEYEGGVLTLKKNGLTVSGTANEYLNIITAIAVSAVTFDNLKGGGDGKEISMILTSDKTTVSLRGKNEISVIIGDSISFAGTKNSQLKTDYLISEADLSVKDAKIDSHIIHSGRDVDIKDSQVVSDYLVSNRDMNINGKSIITLEPSNSENAPYAPASLYVGRNLNVNLSQGGGITAKGFKFDGEKYPGFDFSGVEEILPLLVGGDINLSKSSKMLSGKIGTIDALGFGFKGIVNSNGQPLDSVTINGEGAAVKDAAGSVVQTASTATTNYDGDSPQTGDDTSILAYLYLALLGAGAVALISRKKSARNS